MRLVSALICLMLYAPPGEAAAGDAHAAPEPPGPPIETPSAEEVEEQFPEGSELDGRELYDRFMKNRRRLRTVYQEGRLLSRDPSGNPQQTNFWLRSRDYRDADDEAVDDIFTKVLLKVNGPREMRHTGYLYIERDDDPDEQFMYSPLRGRTFRIALEGQSVAGTDFSFDDFLINLDDLEDGSYKRLPDDKVEGQDCYVVETTMKESANSSYSRSISYLEKAHFVPIKTRYWDDVGVEVKLLTSPHDSIKSFDGAWLPTRVHVVDLLEETDSELFIDVLEPNPAFDDDDFSMASLEFRP